MAEYILHRTKHCYCGGKGIDSLKFDTLEEAAIAAVEMGYPVDIYVKSQKIGLSNWSNPYLPRLRWKEVKHFAESIKEQKKHQADKITLSKRLYELEKHINELKTNVEILEERIKNSI